MASRLLLAFALTAWLGISAFPAEAAEPTGQPDERLAAFDGVMSSFMERWSIPGGALAVTRHGRLVYSRGYGVADVETGEPVQPQALFRLASLSKPVTAVATLRLVQAGRLSLEDRAFTILADLAPADGAWGDARMERITVRDLLQHSGGWNREEEGDPLFQPITRTVANALGVPHPPTCAQIIRYMAGQKLDFEPGVQHGYSNLGYCMLGQIIERVSGQSYEAFVRQEVLDPAGAGGFRLARSLLSERDSGEVRYHANPEQAEGPSVFGGETVARPYGVFYIESFDSLGGWVASAPDYLRFVNAIDGQRGPTLLTPETRAVMTARPSMAGFADTPTYYALGWWVRPQNLGSNWWHLGSLPGTSTLITRLENGVSWTMFFNARAGDRNGLARDLAGSLQPTLRTITSWPEHDLYD